MRLELRIDSLVRSEHRLRKSDPSPRIRYIGSKARIAQTLINIVGYPTANRGRFVDLFCGSGAVSRAAARAGWPTHSNDHLYSSVTATCAQLLSQPQLDFERLGGYEAAVDKLNASPLRNGPIFREYSPSGLSRSGDIRKYFTMGNAAKIDGVREAIDDFYQSGKIGGPERSLLIADLLAAANSVANIAGTYGCFLSEWTKPALSKIRLVPRKLATEMPSASFSTCDAFEFVDKDDDVLYCDPPYTKRQYAAYYHLLETITLGDSPDVVGVSGIRAWEHKASPFCYKRRALKAFSDLIATKRAKKIYISYSSQGHVSLEDMTGAFASFGNVRVHEVKEISRYAPNEASRAKPRMVTEYLIQITR